MHQLVITKRVQLDRSVASFSKNFIFYIFFYFIAVLDCSVDYKRLHINYLRYIYIFFSWHYNPQWGLYFKALLWALASSLTRFLDHIQRRATVGRTPLNEWSVRRRDLYLTTHNFHNTNIHALGGIRTHDLSRRAAEDLRLRPHGHWDRLRYILYI